MKTFISKLENELHSKIEVFDYESSSILKAREVTESISEIMNRLKKFTLSYEFENDEEEILFFKKIKPKFLSYLLYYSNIYNIEINKIAKSADLQIKYYQAEQIEVQQYLDKNIDFVKYYRSNSTFLDHAFFIRRNNANFFYKEASSIDKDPRFSTTGDFKVAQILAIDMTLEFISNALIQLENCSIKISPPKIKVIWTAKKNELIEVLYAFNEIGCFNSGNISLKKLASYFEYVFNVDLQNFSRDFSDMKIRNNKTPFLDKLKTFILRKMNNIKISSRKC